MTVRDRLILALDVPAWEAAEGIVARMQGKIRLFKVGLELFTAEGPRVITRIHDRGGGVFLDLKLHDIPQTVAAAVRKAVEWGVTMLDLHVAGGQAMMRAAVEAAAERATAIGIPRPRLLGVTVLTSLAQRDLQALGITRAVEEQVVAVAGLAKAAGLDGVVASPHEARALRERFGADFLLVTPGIRSRGAAPDDQRRTATARDAIRAGADYLVVGRPILSAADPVAAVEALVAEMETA